MHRYQLFTTAGTWARSSFPATPPPASLQLFPTATALLLARLSAAALVPTSSKECHPRARLVLQAPMAPGAPQHAQPAPLASAPLPASALAVLQIPTLSLAPLHALPALRIRGQMLGQLGVLQVLGIIPRSTEQ